MSIGIGVILGLASAFIWATTSLAVKAQAEEIHPTSFNAFRMAVATVFTFALLPFFVEWQTFAQISPNAVIVLSISSIIGIATGDVLYFWSMTKIGAARALPISGIYPLFTWAIAVPLLGEPVTTNALLGTGLVLLGVYLLAPNNGASAPADMRAERLGMLAAFVAAALWAIATTLLKVGIQESPGVLVVNAIRLPVAAVATACVAQAQVGRKAWRGYNRRTLPRLIALALYSTGIGMIVWTLTVEYAGAARAALLNTAAPLIGVPLSVLALKEHVTPKMVTGTLLIVFGVWLIL